MFSGVDSDRLINLKVVAKIKRGDKLNTRLQQFSIETNSGTFGNIAGSFFRYFSGESRMQTVFALDTLITSSIAKTHGLNCEELEAFKLQLYQTGGGIENLIYTYKDDQTTTSGLELVSQKIKFFLNKYGGFNPPKDMITNSGSDNSLVEEEVFINEGET